jgi:hypothetical protein
LIEQNGFYACYNSGLTDQFYVDNPESSWNLPTEVINSPVTYEINPSGYPQKYSERQVHDIEDNPYITNNGGNSEPDVNGLWPVWIQSNNPDPVYIRQSKSTDTKDSWKVMYSLSCVVSSPGVFKENDTRVKWSDTYTWNGVSFVNTASTHITIDQPIYEPVPADMTVQIKIALRPPLNWHKIDKFQKQVS